jgi:hypothetical protein
MNFSKKKSYYTVQCNGLMVSTLWLSLYYLVFKSLKSHTNSCLKFTQNLFQLLDSFSTDNRVKVIYLTTPLFNLIINFHFYHLLPRVHLKVHVNDKYHTHTHTNVVYKPVFRPSPIEKHEENHYKTSRYSRNSQKSPDQWGHSSNVYNYILPNTESVVPNPTKEVPWVSINPTYSANNHSPDDQDEMPRRRRFLKRKRMNNYYDETEYNNNYNDDDGYDNDDDDDGDDEDYVNYNEMMANDYRLPNDYNEVLVTQRKIIKSPARKQIRWSKPKVVMNMNKNKKNRLPQPKSKRQTIKRKPEVYTFSLPT